MKFYKAEGTKNDFIIINNLYDYDVKKICDRNSGIGADGVILINEIKNDVASITIYNADGSIALTCGNGLRCVAAYCKNILNKNINKIRIKKDSYKVRYLNEGNYEIGFPLVKKIRKEENYYVVNSGNLHVFTLENLLIDDFKNKVRDKYDANVEIVEILDEKTIKVEVDERGVGKTQACGSACIAIVSALCREKKVDKEVNCIMNGGNLKVRIDDKAYLSGKAKIIYEGEYYD